MDFIGDLLDCRDEKEFTVLLKRLDINISAEEVDKLKRKLSGNKSEQVGTLSFQQLDDVAGGFLFHFKKEETMHVQDNRDTLDSYKDIYTAAQSMKDLSLSEESQRSMMVAVLEKLDVPEEVIYQETQMLIEGNICTPSLPKELLNLFAYIKRENIPTSSSYSHEALALDLFIHNHKDGMIDIKTGLFELPENQPDNIKNIAQEFDDIISSNKLQKENGLDVESFCEFKADGSLGLNYDLLTKYCENKSSEHPSSTPEHKAPVPPRAQATKEPTTTDKHPSSTPEHEDLVLPHTPTDEKTPITDKHTSFTPEHKAHVPLRTTTNEPTLIPELKREDYTPMNDGNLRDKSSEENSSKEYKYEHEAVIDKYERELSSKTDDEHEFYKDGLRHQILWGCQEVLRQARSDGDKDKMIEYHKKTIHYTENVDQKINLIHSIADEEFPPKEKLACLYLEIKQTKISKEEQDKLEFECLKLRDKLINWRELEGYAVIHSIILEAELDLISKINSNNYITAKEEIEYYEKKFKKALISACNAAAKNAFTDRSRMRYKWRCAMLKGDKKRANKIRDDWNNKNMGSITDIYKSPIEFAGTLFSEANHMEEQIEKMEMQPNQYREKGHRFLKLGGFVSVLEGFTIAVSCTALKSFFVTLFSIGIKAFAISSVAVLGGLGLAAAFLLPVAAILYFTKGAVFLKRATDLRNLINGFRYASPLAASFTDYCQNNPSANTLNLRLLNFPLFDD